MPPEPPGGVNALFKKILDPPLTRNSADNTTCPQRPNLIIKSNLIQIAV